VSEKPLNVYVIQGRGERDYSDCQAALERVPARLRSLPFLGTAEAVVERTRDADALITSSSPITRRVMESLEGLKAVMRTGVGYDVIDVAAATELGVVVINVPDVWVREVANHALALLLAWNRKIVTLDREVHAGVWSARVPGPVTGSLRTLAGTVGCEHFPSLKRQISFGYEEPGAVRVYDPVPHVITRRADMERAQLLVQSASRPALQGFLAAWSERLFAAAPRGVRWHLDVDPIEFD